MAMVLLLAGAVVIGEIALRILEPALPTHRLWHDPLPALRVRQMLRLRRRGTVDFVMCGSSVMHSGVDPAVVAEASGLSAGYNAALHRGFYDMVVPWLISTVIPILRPRVVVLSAAIYDLNDNGPLLTSEPAAFRRSLLGRDDRVGAAARRLERSSALFRHHRQLGSPSVLAKAIAHRRVGTVVPETDRRDSRENIGPNGEWVGFHGRGYLTTEAMLHHVTRGVLGDFFIGGEQLAIMEKNLRELRKHVDTVILTTVPLSDHLASNLPSGHADIAAASAALRDLAERVGVPLIEPQVELETAEHFADIAHLNDKGMALFSRAVGEQLRQVLSASQPSSPIRTVL